MSAPCRSARRAGLASALALACALTGATLLALTTPAFAQGAAKGTYSPDFVKLYQPVADAVNKGGDLNAAKAQVPAMLAAAKTADDRDAAGGIALQLGIKTSDKGLQRQGLEQRLAGGKVPAAQIGQFNYLAGGLAYEANDFAGARNHFEAARAAGYTDETMPGLLAETYFKQNQNDQGFSYLKSVIAQRQAAHTAIPDAWMLRGLQVAYLNKQAAQANEWATTLVTVSPTPTNWLAALQVVQAVNPLDKGAQLDLYRLMGATGALHTKGDYAAYIEAADPRIMSNEVGRILDSGVASGVLKTSDTDYVEFKKMVDQRAPQDRADAPKLAAQARAAANGAAAMNAGDVYYSLAQYDQAADMYQLAIQKGGVDKDRALTRLGIAQVQGGKAAAAKATFAQVSGARAPVAHMWQAYAQTKAA